MGYSEAVPPRLYDALVLDVDGTLLNEAGKLHPRTRAALGRARAQGVKVMLATGRSAAGVRDVARDLELDTPAVVFNGAAVYSPFEDRLLECTILPEPLVERVLLHALQSEVLPVVAREDGQFAYTGFSDSQRRVLAEFRSLHLVDGPELPRKEVIRVTLLSERHTSSAQLRAEIEPLLPAPCYLTDFPLNALPGLRSSTAQVLDVQPNCPGKAEAMRVLEQRYGIPSARVVAVGDANNDLPMLRAAGLGVAMGNATPEAKQAAKRVIGDNSGDALGALVEELFLV